MFIIDFIRNDNVQSVGHYCKIKPGSITQELAALGLFCDNDCVTVHYLAYYTAVDYQINK